MSLDKDTFDRLSAPFPPESVKWRVGRAFWKRGESVPDGAETTAIALAYIDARDVMNRLDEVIGFGNWDCQTRVYETKSGTVYVATLNIRFGPEWMMSYEGVSDESDFESIKGGASGAFKRAAVHIGIGRYLYDLGETKAKVQGSRGNWYIKDEEVDRLNKMMKKLFPFKQSNPTPVESETYDFTGYRKKYIAALIEDKGKAEAAKIMTALLDQFGVSGYDEITDLDKQQKFIAAIAIKLSAKAAYNLAGTKQES